MLCVLEFAGQEQGESIITPAGIRMRFSEFGLVSTSLLLQTDSLDQIAFWPHISPFLFYKGLGVCHHSHQTLCWGNSLVLNQNLIGSGFCKAIYLVL